MLNLIETSKNIYEKFFDNFVKSFEPDENYLKFIWLTFAYLKKKILKRKNDYESSSCLLCCIFEIFRTELRNQILKKDSNAEIGIGNYELYYREIFSNRIQIINTNFLKENLNSILKEFDSLKSKEDKNEFFFVSNINCLNKNIENYKLLESAYDDILISDEIHDLKIFENYFTNKKLNSNIFSNKSFSITKPSYSTSQNGINFNNTSCEMLESQSPFNNKIMPSPKFDIDIFFKDVGDNAFLDISYLFLKFGLFRIENKTFKYEKLFNEFYNKFLNPVLNSINEKIELNNENHKNLFLKLADDLLQQEKIKFEEKDFNFILNDESFHFNFLILTFFIYLNFLLIERNSTLDELCVNYFKRLNEFEYFEYRNIFKIIKNLTKIEMPFIIDSTIKKFQKGLISFVLWECRNFLLEYTTELSDEEIMDMNKICDKILLHTVSIIYKLSNCFNIEAKSREKIWKIMKILFTSEIKMLKHNHLDCIIVHIIYFVLNTNQTENISESKNLLLNLCNKYLEIGNTPMFKNVFYENLRKFEANGFLEDLNRLYISLENNYSKSKTKSLTEQKFQSKYLDYELSAIIPCLQEDFNVIYSVSPISNKISQDQIISLNKSDEHSVEYVGKKRIRQLNSPLSSNLLIFSPYSRRSSFTVKNISAFKNLNTVLMNTKKDK